MDKWLFRIAGGFVFIVLLAHEILGAPMVLPPLHDQRLPDNVVWLHHFAWHVGSIAMIAMICLFFIGARDTGGLAMVFIATGMCVGFAALGLGLAVFGSASMWGTPAPYVWAVASVIGGIGIGIRRRSIGDWRAQ